MRVLISLGLLCLPALAQGYFDLGGFKTPRGDVVCVATWDRIAEAAGLRCDLHPARSKNCTDAFHLGERGPAIRFCANQTIDGSKLPVLAHGRVWDSGFFRCELNWERLRCVNRDRRGFELSPRYQRFF
ncbi:MAG: hypothetical protein NZ849_08915 [Meiothermus sp.]|uniref:hypothetical protein n=1 Tax=Meiothermus sp. TaxID=1955249 RepID=UPI00298EF75E|nr:hypothetical protein [Meiothermus sp.]MCS7195010.1 hypothetical protein [Meiothermus sp.]MDW8089906.1 hypothetical protein [Meiothermus sp.]